MPTPFSHPCHENIIVLSCRKGTEGSLHHPKIVEFCGEIFVCVVAGSEHNCICFVSSHHLLLSNFQQGQNIIKDVKIKVFIFPRVQCMNVAKKKLSINGPSVQTGRSIIAFASLARATFSSQTSNRVKKKKRTF